MSTFVGKYPPFKLDANGNILVSISGSIPASTIAITDDNTTNAEMLPVWVTTNTGNLPAKVSSTKITFNPSTGSLTAANFLGTATHADYADEIGMGAPFSDNQTYNLVTTLSVGPAIATVGTAGITYNPFTNVLGTSLGLAGSPTTTTQASTDNSTKVSTTAFVATAIANALAGTNQAVEVSAATTAAANTSTWTYNNGVAGVGATFTGPVNTAITIDSILFNTITTQSLLIKNDTQSPSGAFNGTYLFTAAQTAVTGAVFTRRTDYNSPSNINNTGAIPVVGGTVNALTSWLLTSSVTTVGTSPINYSQFSYSPLSIIAPSLGGTGIANNAASTITISGNFGTTFFVSGITSVNLPTSGLLTTLATVVSSTNLYTAAQRGQFQTLTDASTVAVNLAIANNYDLTLGGNRTLGVPTNPVAGQSGTITVRQDITGSRTLAYAWPYEFQGGVAPVLSTGKLNFDQLYYMVNTYTTATVTVTIAAPGVMTWTGHGLVSGQKIQLSTTGALPTGLAASTTYWITVINANTFNLSTSLANAQAATFITTTGSQSGVQTAVAFSITINPNLAIA